MNILFFASDPRFKKSRSNLPPRAGSFVPTMKEG